MSAGTTCPCSYGFTLTRELGKREGKGRGYGEGKGEKRIRVWGGRREEREGEKRVG